jgi:hypothetical protein
MADKRWKRAERDIAALRGVSCSAACLDAQMPRLIGVEADAGDRWRDTRERELRT